MDFRTAPAIIDALQKRVEELEAAQKNAEESEK